MHPPHETPLSQIAPVVLAAGSASRMGGRPKCLLRIDGEPIIARLLRAAGSLGLQMPVVVVGAFAQEVEAALPPGGARVVRNVEPGADQTRSLRLGLQATHPEAQAILVLLADQPLIETRELLDLIQAYQLRPNGAAFVQPTWEGLPGNPVLFAAQVRDEVLAADSAMSPKAWAQQHPSRRFNWVTDNPRYRVDLDTPDDLLALQQRFGVEASWPAA